MFERLAKLVKTDRVRSWRLAQATRSIFLTEFISAFFLAMRYFFKPKATINYPFERDRSHPAFAASLRCGAIRMGRSAASPASCARRSARHRPSPSRRGRGATTARGGPPASTSI